MVHIDEKRWLVMKATRLLLAALIVLVVTVIFALGGVEPAVALDKSTVPGKCQPLIVIIDGKAEMDSHTDMVANAISSQAPDADVMFIDVMNGNGCASPSDVAEAIDKAINENADVICLPMYMRGSDDALVAAVSRAISSGCAVVAAAGNDGADVSQYVPASIDGVVTASAVDSEGRLLPASNFGDAVDVYVEAGNTSEAAGRAAGWLAVHPGIEAAGVGNAAAFPAEESFDGEALSGDGMLHQAAYTLTIRFNANGGTIADSPHNNGSNWYKLTSSLVYRSTSKTGTYSVYEQAVSTDTTYPNLVNVGTFGITRTGYHITGTQAYNTKSDGTGNNINQDYSSSSTTNAATTTRMNGGTALTANKTITLYVKWVANTYSVAYNGNGATSGSMSNSSHTYGTAKALTSNAYAKTGYRFAGWATSQANANAGTVAYTNGRSVTNLTATNGATVTLYAVWTANTYSVAYNGNGATSGSMSNSSHTYGTAKTLTSNAYAKTGYRFAGWATSTANANAGTVAYSNGQSVSNLTATNNATVTLYAVWAANTYSVKFNANGGTGSMPDQLFAYGASQHLSVNLFRKDGYNFGGWATSLADANSGTAAYSDWELVSDLTSTNNATVNLYAVWQGNTYYVNFNANGGRGTMANQTFTYGTAQPLTANAFYLTGYHLAGWSESIEDANAGVIAYADGESVSTLTMVAWKTKDLYASWALNTYVVRFNANGGGGTMADQQFVYDTKQSLTPNGFIAPTGLHFGGWATSAQNAAAGIVAYKDTQLVSNLVEDHEGVLDLYAIWVDFNNIRQVEDGVYEVELQPGMMADIPDVPGGTPYRVYEETEDGWVLVSQSNATGSIQPLQTSYADFLNQYVPDVASAVLYGSKTLDNRAVEAGTYSFELWEGSTLRQTKAVQGGGAIVFDALTYDSQGMHTYTIKEVIGNDDSITWDRHEETVTVLVQDLGNGLTAAVEYDSDGVRFANKHNPGNLRMTKHVQGQTSANADDEFEFEIVLRNPNGEPITDGVYIHYID